MTQTELLQRIKERLRDLYGGRFRGLVLYGSAARGEAGEDSDIDLLCLLEGPIDVSDEICHLIDHTTDIKNDQKENYRPIHIFPVDVREYDKNFPLYIEARKEGLPV